METLAIAIGSLVSVSFGLWVGYQVLGLILCRTPKVATPTAAQRDAARAARLRQLRSRLFR